MEGPVKATLTSLAIGQGPAGLSVEDNKASRGMGQVAKKRQRRLPWLDIFLFTILFVALAAGGFAVYMVSKAYENLPALANLEPNAV